jgi:NAD(P)-dependent dehydrogenase (short-subunit alcohol dehydrogenase family)
VIITGGSSGIGLEMAYVYLRRGCKVTIVARDEKKLNLESKKLLTLLPQCEDKLLALSIDLSTNEKTVKSKLKASIEKFGNCDVLVNCAGTSVAAAFEDLKESDFQWMLNVNLLGTLTHLVASSLCCACNVFLYQSNVTCFIYLFIHSFIYA